MGAKPRLGFCSLPSVLTVPRVIIIQTLNLNLRSRLGRVARVGERSVGSMTGDPFDSWNG